MEEVGVGDILDTLMSQLSHDQDVQKRTQADPDYRQHAINHEVTSLFNAAFQ